MGDAPVTSQPAVDCDVHCLPSIDAVAEYLPSHWRQFVEDYGLGPPRAVEVAYPSISDVLATTPENTTFERVSQAVFAHADIAILNCYYGVDSFTHPYLAADIATAVNRWLAEHWLDRDPRFRASALVTPQHPAAAVAEIERISGDSRFVQILVPARAATAYGNQRYWPIWEAAAEHGLAVAIAYGGGSGTSPTSITWPPTFFETYTTAGGMFQNHIISLALTGVFSRRPELRVVIVESGVTFLPALCWRLDENWKAYRREVPWVIEPPSAYIRRSMRFTTTPFDGPAGTDQLREICKQIGADDLLMYGSDFPHTYPEDPAAPWKELGAAAASRVLGGNAREWYGFAEATA